jgi:serine protease Do
MKRFLLFVVLVFLFVVGLWGWKNRKGQAFLKPEKFTPAAAAAIDPKQVEVLSALSDAQTRLAEAVVPSVVSITTAKRVLSEGPLYLDPFIGRFYRGIPQESIQNALGSGVVVSKEGHVLTNYHVAAGADEIKVQLNDGRVEPAQYIGGDSVADIAVLKIEAAHVPPLPFGDSNQVKVGQIVFAIGNPYGLHETVTDGIISATGRRQMSDTGREYFQTSAAINPGNSGGPLVNLRGEVIGINTWIASSSGGSQGLGFAIPANSARRVMEAILKKGRVQRGFLGVVIQELTPELAAKLQVPDTSGALISEITPGSPAEKAGLRRGDVIREVDGESIRSPQDFQARIAQAGVGSTIKLGILRGGKAMTIQAITSEQPAPRSIGSSPGSQLPQPPRGPQVPRSAPPSIVPQTPAPDQSGPNILSGIQVAEITPERKSNLPSNARGVMVTGIDPDSPAGQSLQQGDVIEEINQQPVRSVQEYQAIARTLGPADKVILFICRGKTRSFVVLSPE